MNSPEWNKLVKAARMAADDRSEAPPYGFSTRVVARAARTEAQPPGFAGLFQGMAMRALAVAGFLVVTSVSLNLPYLFGSAEDETAIFADPVTEILEVSEG